MPRYEVTFSGFIEVEADDEEQAEMFAKDELEMYCVVEEVTQLA